MGQLWKNYAHRAHRLFKDKYDKTDNSKCVRKNVKTYLNKDPGIVGYTFVSFFSKNVNFPAKNKLILH